MENEILSLLQKSRRNACCTLGSVLGFLTLFFLTGETLWAVPRNPPPVFESDYTLPVTEKTFPSCPLVTENFTAVALYLVFLLVAGLAAYRWRSRKILFLTAAASLAILGFAMQGCPCPVGMFQNIIDAFVQPLPFIPWTVILLFSIPLFASLLFGRIFCSSVCPLGAVQELTALKNIRIPEGVEKVLGLFRYVVLGLGAFLVYTGLGYWVCRFDPYVGFFRFGGLFPVMVFSGLLLIVGFFIGRPFCRFLCPYGALLGLCGHFSWKKISVTPGDCTKCRLCEEICPYNAVLQPTVTPNNQERRRGTRYLVFTFAALPVLMLLFGIMGYYVAPKFAVWHFDVRRAELLYAEEQKLTDSFGSFPETRAMFQLGSSNNEVYRAALNRFERFRRGGLYFGLWLGAVIGFQLISLSLRRRRKDYEVDPSRCVACGRCFWYCPNQKEERILLN